jgi:hypothetical protein
MFRSWAPQRITSSASTNSIALANGGTFDSRFGKMENPSEFPKRPVFNSVAASRHVDLSIALSPPAALQQSLHLQDRLGVVDDHFVHRFQCYLLVRDQNLQLRQPLGHLHVDRLLSFHRSARPFS